MPPPKARLLVIADGGVPSGFARVIRSIFGRLRGRYEIHQLALGYLGDPHAEPWPMYSAAAHGDPFGTNRIPRIVATLRPDLVFVIHEPSIASAWVRALADCMPLSRIVVYMAIEAGPLPSGIAEQMRGVGRWVTYTEFARRQVAASGVSADAVEVIPHGVDTSMFRRLATPGRPASSVPDRRVARRKLGLEHAKDTFVVLNANRNQGRKRIDVTIDGFARFARDKPTGVKLYLHMGLRDVGWDIRELCRRHQLQDRVILATDDIRAPRLSDRELNLVYNACDVGINTAMCEGWGLVSVEHAAAGAAQIVPRHTACAELWQDAAVMLEPVMTTIHPPSLEEVFLIGPDAVADALQYLYDDRRALARWRRAAFANATRKEWSWREIARQWATVIDQQLHT